MTKRCLKELIQSQTSHHDLLTVPWWHVDITFPNPKLKKKCRQVESDIWRLLRWCAFDSCLGTIIPFMLENVNVKVNHQVKGYFQMHLSLFSIARENDLSLKLYWKQKCTYINGLLSLKTFDKCVNMGQSYIGAAASGCHSQPVCAGFCKPYVHINHQAKFQKLMQNTFAEGVLGTEKEILRSQWAVSD